MPTTSAQISETTNISRAYKQKGFYYYKAFVDYNESASINTKDVTKEVTKVLVGKEDEDCNSCGSGMR